MYTVVELIKNKHNRVRRVEEIDVTSNLELIF